MPLPGTHSDGLRLQLSGADLVSMRVVGAIAGVYVLAAAARNGIGAGTLTARSGGLCWQAPGSSIPGAIVACPIDGSYLLEDGTDPSCWLRVQVAAGYLAKSGGASIEIGDSFNALGPADVAASDALAGLISTTQYTLKNVSGNTVETVTLWIDPAAAGSAEITVSSDGTNFFDPTSQTDPNVLAWASIATGASVNVWVKRTIPASSAFNPKILNALQWGWVGH